MLKSGDKLEVIFPFTAFSGERYERGMILELIEPTGLTPFGHKSGLCNWVVKCPFFKPPQDQSVWSGIWIGVDRGWLKVVK